MAALGIATGARLSARCGCDALQASCRGVYISPLRFAPPRSAVRVVAEVERSARGRAKKTKSNAVDANAVVNSATDDVEGRVSSGKMLRSVEEGPEQKKAPQVPLEKLLMRRLKLDKALDEVVGFMAPREKGDIRDVILMSLSFAVLVYISQRLVCLYCVVRHMASHTF